MVLDYSKWDKLELSDDSDIEVHPNVDKKSFIRWKQRDIHEKREQAKFRMLQLELNIETNEDLKIRINKLIKAANEGRKIGLNIEDDVKLSQEGETKLQPAKATSPEQPRYTDMIESMLLQCVSDGSSQEKIITKLHDNLKMIESALKDESKELQTLQEEKKKHITAEDMHTGWDSTITSNSKPKQTPLQPSSSSQTATSSKKIDSNSTSTSGSGSSTSSKVTTIETLNSPSAPPKPRVNEDGLEELLPQTKEFGELPKEAWEQDFNFMMRYPFIVTEGQKDALTMSAFEYELAGDTEHTERVVWNSTLIQLCLHLGRDGTKVFYKNIIIPNSPARKMFEETVLATYTHIQNRCKILAAEHENEEAEETIQLRSVDPDVELLVRIPEEGSEGYKIYESFSKEAKEAIDAHSLDALNEVLGKMSIEDAEDFVGKLGDSGVIQVESKIYEPEEFEAKRETALEQAPTIDDVD